MSLYRKIMSSISETYRIRNGYGLSPIRNERELKALVDFCESQLKEEHIQKYNDKERWVFEVTIAMYCSGEVRDILFNKKFNPKDWDYTDIYSFIEDHIGYYWS